MGEKGFNFWNPYVFRVAFVMKQDVTTNPLNVSFFRAVGVVLKANGLAHLIEQFFRRLRRLH
jgi:hypothetical protein